jgi:hypothetical protein
MAERRKDSYGEYVDQVKRFVAFKTAFRVAGPTAQKRFIRELERARIGDERSFDIGETADRRG